MTKEVCDDNPTGPSRRYRTIHPNKSVSGVRNFQVARRRRGCICFFHPQSVLRHRQLRRRRRSDVARIQSEAVATVFQRMPRSIAAQKRIFHMTWLSAPTFLYFITDVWRALPFSFPYHPPLPSPSLLSFLLPQILPYPLFLPLSRVHRHTVGRFWYIYYDAEGMPCRGIELDEDRLEMWLLLSDDAEKQKNYIAAKNSRIAAKLVPIRIKRSVE